MDNQIKDLVPKYNSLRNLYQEADFQLLLQFLSDCRIQVEQQIHSLKPEDINFTAFTYGLIQQSNLLGTLIELPKIILKLKEEFERIELQQKEFEDLNKDPLNEGE